MRGLVFVVGVVAVFARTPVPMANKSQFPRNLSGLFMHTTSAQQAYLKDLVKSQVSTLIQLDKVTGPSVAVTEATPQKETKQSVAQEPAPAPSGSLIDLMNVAYGHNCPGFKASAEYDQSVVRSVSGQCSLKDTCTYKIYNINFGDGSDRFPNCNKDFLVEYKCTQDPAGQVHAVLTRGANGRTLVFGCTEKPQLQPQPQQSQETVVAKVVATPPTAVPKQAPLPSTPETNSPSQSVSTQTTKAVSLAQAAPEPKTPQVSPMDSSVEEKFRVLESQLKSIEQEILELKRSPHEPAVVPASPSIEKPTEALLDKYEALSHKLDAWVKSTQGRTAIDAKPEPPSLEQLAISQALNPEQTQAVGEPEIAAVPQTTAAATEFHAPPQQTHLPGTPAGLQPDMLVANADDVPQVSDVVAEQDSPNENAPSVEVTLTR
eukprot:c475_g1_i1.p1 GENE.c475_g1_i1~~c475_g1_i1.p1  ORF type:complete len:432 (+),score=97.81 c475_g1_i1:32-1327(+)